MNKLKRKKGLTFIEMLVTIAVLSLLMSIAYPAYDKYIKDSNADNLKNQLIDMSNDFDRIKRKTYTYKGILNSDGDFNTDIAPLVYPRDGNNIRFTLEVVNVEHSSYKVIATPVNIQGEDYGRLSFSFENGNLIGLYDIDNDDTWTERWY